MKTFLDPGISKNFKIALSRAQIFYFALTELLLKTEKNLIDKKVLISKYFTITAFDLHKYYFKLQRT